MTFPLSGDRQFYSEKHTIAAGATVRIRLQFQPDTIKFVSMVSITGRVDIKLGGMKGQGLIPLFLQGPVDLPGLEPEQRIELTNQDTIPHTILVVAQKGYQPAGINAPAVSADVAHELLSSQHADTVVATPPIEGDLVIGIEQGDASILWQRLPRGTVGQALIVQADGSLAWADASVSAFQISKPADDGETQNRSTGASFSWLEQPIRIMQPVILSEIQWDIRNLGDYTLEIRTQGGTVLATKTEDQVQGENVPFVLTENYPLYPGLYRVRLTKSGGVVTWWDTNSTGHAGPIWQWASQALYNGTGYNYTAPMTLIATTGFILIEGT